MRALILEKTGRVHLGSLPLRLVELPTPIPNPNEVLIRISACGICHTELDEIEGRTPPAHLQMVLGHQAVGRIVGLGEQVTEWSMGERVGVAWIFSACGQCDCCLSGYENLCEQFQATGRDCNGGYAELMCAKASFVHRIPNELIDVEAAPLLCAGAIGYRSLHLTQLVNGQTLGLTGFGGSAHLVLKLARHRLPRSPIYVFARSKAERAFAVELGATWVGSTDEHSPILLDAIIDTTPAWLPIVRALENLAPAGRLVINAIRKESTDQSELLRLNYAEHLWLEKEVKSVANVTRDDVRAFLRIAADCSIRPTTCHYRLVDANQALVELKTRIVVGAKVLMLQRITPLYSLMLKLDNDMNQTITLKNPWLVAVWPGMGQVAISAGYYLMSKLDMHLLAEFSPKDLFDVEHVEVREGLIRAVRLPRIGFFLWTAPEAKRDLLVFTGEAQPPRGKNAFCTKLIEYAQRLGVKRLFTFAAMATGMHPEHASRVFGAAIDMTNLSELQRLSLRMWDRLLACQPQYRQAGSLSHVNKESHH